ncbi:MAG: NAD(P)/FAD-dependent oxidoreductase [Candidatus Wallbacteria bacterium]|nr:NAD(P)/FAD-dependent oxidoreductase [Candidatus Wallbacteria bacterium]
MSAAAGREEFDVIVVGAGPAGLSAARSAAQSGARTLLLERNNEIGIPVRTSGASWLQDMRRLGVPAHFCHPTRRVVLSGPGRRVEFAYDPPVNCVLDVRGLWQHLAMEASRAGAAVRVRSKVAALADGSLEVSGAEGPRILRSPVTIDATGVAAVVARARGLGSPGRRAGIGAELELYAPNWDEELLLLAVGTQVAPSGYAWVFPAGQGRVRAGVGLLAPDSGVDPAPYLRRLIRESRELSGAAELEYHRGVIPSEGPIPATVADGLLVVGDAAGQVLATAGEGIRFALELGELAGRVAGQAIRTLSTEAQGLREYESEWSRRYRGLFTLMDRVNRKLATFDDAAWDLALAGLEKAGPRVAELVMRGDVLQGATRQKLAEAVFPILGWLL